MQKRTLIITGMHRSGTSLITHWLTRCGLQTGEKLEPANIGNVEGHFEDVEFLKMHEEILAEKKLPKTGLTDEEVNAFSACEKEKLKNLISNKQQLNDQWGWKDPRTCLFLEAYEELLPDALYLVILRDYKSVVGSLLRREFKHLDNKYLHRKYLARLVRAAIGRAPKQHVYYKKHATSFLKIWIAYNQRILTSINKLPAQSFVVINYSLLQKEDTQVFEHLKNNWDFSLQYFGFKDIFKENLIGPEVDIDPYINDKSLIKKAEQLQNDLKAYMMDNGIAKTPVAV